MFISLVRASRAPLFLSQPPRRHSYRLVPSRARPSSSSLSSAPLPSPDYSAFLSSPSLFLPILSYDLAFRRDVSIAFRSDILRGFNYRACLTNFFYKQNPLFSFFVYASPRPPLVPTIILDFSLGLTHAFCYPSCPPTLSLSPSFRVAPSPILPRAFLFSLSAARCALPFFLSAHTSSFLLAPSSSFLLLASLSRDSSSSSSLCFARHFFSLSLAFSPFLFSSNLRPQPLFLSFPSHVYLSFFASRFILPLARVSDLADFALSFYPPRSSPSLHSSLSLSLCFPCHSFSKHTLLSSRSIELRSSSSFYLAKFLVPPRPLLLLLLLRLQFSSVSLHLPSRHLLLSLGPTGFSRRCVSRSLPLFILLFTLRSFSLFLSPSLFLSRDGQELLILCRKLVRGPPDLFGWARMTLILKYYLDPPPPRGRARVCAPSSLSLVSHVCTCMCVCIAKRAQSTYPRKLQTIYSSWNFDNVHMRSHTYTRARVASTFMRNN